MPFFKKENHVKFTIGDREYDINTTMLRDMVRRKVNGINEDYKDKQVRSNQEGGSLSKEVESFLRSVWQRLRDSN